MQTTKYLIIGGGIAGTNATETIRHQDPDSTITLITEEKERLYSRVLLPQFLRNTVEYDRVFLKKPDFYSLNRIDFKPNSKVTKIDSDQKLIQLENGEQIGYEKLLIATGSKLLSWSVKGSQLEGVFYLRTVEQAQEIRKALTTAKEGVVVGGGFIALEFVSTFKTLGLKTTLLVKEPYFFEKFLDLEGGRLIEKLCQEKGVAVIVGDECSELVGDKQVEKVKTATGKELPAQIIGVGIGVRPDITFLEGSKVAKGSYITTNEYLETSVPGIWAAGDVTNFYDKATDRFHSLGNWANAADQGRVAGMNMAGEKTEFIAVSAYSITFFGNSLSIIGDVDSSYADSKIVRRSGLGRGLLYIKNKQIIGATLVNLAMDRHPLTYLIKNKKQITDLDALGNPDFDLNKLLND